MKRIALITEIYPPEIGGPATFIRSLARELTKQHGKAVTVACLSRGSEEEPDGKDGVRVCRLVKPGTPYDHLVLRARLATVLAVNSKVLINGLERIAVPLARRIGRSFVLKVVGDVVWETARNAGLTTLGIDPFQTCPLAHPQLVKLRAQRNSWVGSATTVVTPSRYLQRMVQSWGCPAERVITIENGTDRQAVRGAHSAAQTGRPLKVLFVGRLTNWKGVETLLLALTRVQGAEVTVCGDGPELPHLVELATQLGLKDRVQFGGRAAQAEVAQFMAESDVLVLTSLYEGMSHTLLEAMAAGLVCIASRIGGNPETIVHEESGLLIEPQNVEQLVGALSMLARSPEMLARLSEGAVGRSLGFSMQRTTEAYSVLMAGKTAA